MNLNAYEWVIVAVIAIVKAEVNLGVLQSKV